MSEETVWQGLAAILPIFHWTVLPLGREVPYSRFRFSVTLTSPVRARGG